MKPWRYGEVVNADSTAKPVVKLDGESAAAPVRNYGVGYVPEVGDRVIVLVWKGDRVVIGQQALEEES